jgi:methionyl-tRNA formyltransferase
MNILFAGTPEPSARILEHLLDCSDLNVVGVLSQPDKPQKRGKIVAESPVSSIATLNQIKIYKPNDLNDANFIKDIQLLNIDVLLVAAYGKILPDWLLEISNIVPINIHYSLLPLYRGASPIQTSLMNGDTNTGVTFMKMVKGLDEGDIIKKYELKIKQNHNKISLENDLCLLSIRYLNEVLDLIKINKFSYVKQDNDLASYCSKIKKSDSIVNFDSPAEEIFNKFRAYYEWPGTAFNYKDIRIKICEMTVSDIISSKRPGNIFKFDSSGLYINTSTKVIVITYLQFPGKKIISSSDAFNAYKSFFV